MNFYPLFEEVRKGSESSSIVKKLLSTYPDKYGPHSRTGRLMDRKNTSMEEFRKDVEEAADELGLELLRTEIIPPGKQNPKAKSDTYKTLHVVMKDRTRKDTGLILASSKGRNKTSTGFKEGMVCFFFGSQNEYEPFEKRGKNTEEVYFPLVEEIIKDIERNGIEGVDQKTIKEISDSLKNGQEDYDKDLLDAIFNAMSIGNYLRNSKEFSNWDINRDKLFDDLKKAGKKITGYPEDKWCPMDIVLVKNGEEPDVRNTLSEINSSDDSREAKLGKLNGMFIDKWDSKNPDSILAAISLKEQKAQHGKAKSYVDSIETPDEMEYNLTTEEKEWRGDNEKIRKEISKIRKEINEELKGPKLKDRFDYKTKPSNFDKFGYNSKGEEVKTNYLGKYGSLKMLRFFLEEFKRNKDVFINLASYGLSLGVNPTFFKLIGNAQGDPERVEEHLETFTREGGVEEYHSPGKDYDNSVWITDNNTNAGVQLVYWVVFSSWIYVVYIQIRSNQTEESTTQVIVEIQKFDKYKDLT